MLAAEDLTLVEEAVPGAVGAIELAVGQEAKVALYPGRPILESQLGAPALVERNAVVRMTYADGPLRIVTEGRALDRAAAGEPVRVMNLASRQTVTGTVGAGRQHRGGSADAMRQPLFLAGLLALAACGIQDIGQPPEMTTIGAATDDAKPILDAERAAIAVPPPQPARYAYQQALAVEHHAVGPARRPPRAVARRHPDRRHRDRRRGRDAQLDLAHPRGQRGGLGRRLLRRGATCCRRAR